MWVYGLVSGLLFGTAMTGFSALRDDGGSWRLRIVLGVLAGILFGVGMSVFMRRDFGASRDELVALTVEQRRAVLRAAGRGPAPSDPEIRAVALRQAQRGLDLLRRRRLSSLVVFGLALVLEASLALTSSPWWWFAVAMFAAAVAAQFILPRRLERRIGILSAPPGPYGRRGR
jgi:MFS family permease